MVYLIWLVNKPTFWEEPVTVERTLAGSVEANSLDDAFMKSQGGIGFDWAKRSSSVGDVIQEGEKFHLICGIGFKEIPKPSL